MSSGTVANLVTIAAALIGVAGSIAAALIGRRRDEEITPPRPPADTYGSAHAGMTHAQASQWYADNARRRTSRAVWYGAASMVTWIIPVIGIFTVAPGLYYGVRDLAPGRYRKLAWLGIALCSVALIALLANSAAGANAGAHGTGWWQQ